ncbi:SGNH/GDSL hydrolase family protein [Pseudozobellia thermophila]|uniref:Lysophospholipase L1 n=1 Tax=Pseudozobellia thermophila TaxID=192903 RepID=A0A1M6NZK7_9FLAO|nr:SGNH/GDSL hydrolase family protein [Pseudozobellia thermophila]SHK01157.1 hypothetical protein SAMN04488513_1173 [Pseudozobellia thermophila]
MNGFNKKTLVGLLTLSVTIIFACNQNNTEPLNILLVGNSSIYYNNMPEMLEKIAYENGNELKTKLIAFGGYTLRDHLNDGIVEKALDSVNWDFVVLNEQSTFGENYVVNGLQRVRESESFYETVREFDSLIKEKGAKTLIISLYPRNNVPPIDGEILDYSYMKIAKELDLELAPVSKTWRDILKADGQLELYQDDNLHPTSLGSFVTASVIYSTITDSKSKPIKGEITGSLIDKFDGVKQKDSIVSLIKINESESRTISEIVFENVQKLNRAGGYLNLKKPD